MKTAGLEKSLGTGIRAFVSLREAAVLAGIPEKLVRKDIEARVLAPARLPTDEERPCFRWPDVFLFAAVYRNHTLTRELRKLALSRLETLISPDYRSEDFGENDFVSTLPSCSVLRCDRMKIDDYIFLDFDKALDEWAPRVDLYATGLSKIEEKEGRLGGEATFRSTRLPVRHIGKMFAAGEPLENILEDYPYLNEDDVKFARLYSEAHPMVGRPRADAETGNASRAAR